ncbi:RluA family pseudouridine synthase [Paenibacillus crassostreae]|uniref:Pseudouridine synthase n=1 Tax=Paenibacillus crassostreae TaxID=1763538 RepID=A0A167GHK1_9BACL|nr:RluA family pseudouridine synthase [Paenibacillus crassostreae]AOZ92120.1 RNA pseudouridine synthase [Paenibacillus crassostreae]OAB77581.1 RNA pseudouridine synthase [Paenibacillus crassostreae]
MKNKQRSGQGQQPSYNKAKTNVQGNRKGKSSHLVNKSTSSHHDNQSLIKQYPVHEVSELLVFLVSTLSNEGRNSIKSMLARGQILVNGRPETAYNFPLQPGNTVTVSKGKIVEEIPLIGLRIMFEDDDIIVVNKEAGLLSVASAKENELTAYRQLTAHVRESNPNNRIFVVHRLDRDTSGVMMFAKNEEVKQTLQNSWQDSVKERTYIALVEGKIKKPEGTIKSWLKESSTLKMYSSPYPNDGQEAITHYKMIQSNNYFSLLEVNLETGRKNQIRVHMQDIGHPVAGDKKYGAKTKTIGRLGLHAQILAFEHPTKGEVMTFKTDIPKTFLHPFRLSPTT